MSQQVEGQELGQQDDEIAYAFFRLQANKERLDQATRLLVEIIERAMASE